MTRGKLFFVHYYQSLGILSVSITTPICRTPVDCFLSWTAFTRDRRPPTAAFQRWPEGPFLAGCCSCRISALEQQESGYTLCWFRASVIPRQSHVKTCQGKHGKDHAHIGRSNQPRSVQATTHRRIRIANGFRLVQLHVLGVLRDDCFLSSAGKGSHCFSVEINATPLIVIRLRATNDAQRFGSHPHASSFLARRKSLAQPMHPRS